MRDDDEFDVAFGYLPSMYASRREPKKPRLTPTARLRMAQHGKRVYNMPHVKAAFLANAGQKHSEEVKTKLRIASTVMWRDPAMRKAILEKQAVALADPKERERRSKAAKAYWAKVKAALKENDNG